MVERLYTNARTGTYKHPSRDVGVVMEIGRGARSGWVELGWRMGRRGTTNGAGWDVGWVGAEQRALTSGAGAPLFGEIDTYGWDGARLIRRDWHVWLGRPLESKPPPEECTLRIGIPWLIDRNTEIALSVRRNCFIGAVRGG